jgi:hypothetical protein
MPSRRLIARRRTDLRRLTVALAAIIATAAVLAAETAEKPAAHDLFEQTLAAEGLDAAVDTLARVIAVAATDSIELHAIDAYELGIGLPSRLVIRHQREEALALIQTIAPLFGEHPRYFKELGLAYLRCGRAEEARAALTRAAELGNRPDLAWMVAHLDELVAMERLKAEREDRLVPGASTGLHGLYLGQTPPGAVPEVFAPGILNTTAHEYHLSFAPDGREIVFSRGGVGTLVTRWEEDGWTVPEVVHLIDEDHLTEEANLTPDGQAIVFCGRARIREPRILYRAERSDRGWGPPTELFPGMYATSALDGSLYYTIAGEGRDYGAIVRRARVGDGYGEPELVGGEGVNTPAPDAHPWIAPDGQLLLFDSYRDPGMGIYAVCRRSDGVWGRAIPLGERLGIPPVGQPALSHDLKYLFFCLAGDMYWVDAGFLVEVRRESARE